MGQRGQTGGTNKQGTLTSFFDISVGTGTYAPKKKQAYASKRLQKIVQDYRKERKEKGASASPAPKARASRAVESPSRGDEAGQVEASGSTISKQGHAGEAKQAGSTSNTSKRKRKTAAAGASEHGTTQTAKGKKRANKKRRVAEGEDGSEDEVRGRVTSDVASNRELRPRRPVQGQPLTGPGDGGGGEEGESEDADEDEENAFIRRRRR